MAATQKLANGLHPNREYKSRIFTMVFSQKKELLELYNAMNGTDYEDPEQLEINTLENAIYLAMKNDISFLVDSCLSLYEHQSTYNPNIPLRFLEYVTDLYSGMTRNKNLYGTRLIEIPPPEFVVFYNGIAEKPDVMELKLSDAYGGKGKHTALELKVRMLNVNKGHNLKLMEACKTLRDYAEYTNRVREYGESMDISEAVERAITECIQEGILSDFLSRNRAEAKKMSIYEYDEEKHMRMEREENYAYGKADGLEEGREEGRQEGETRKLVSLVCKKLQKKYSVSDIAEILEESEAKIENICEIAEKYAPDYEIGKIAEEVLKKQE
jgi:predicted transposase/invertase (TIGR01784 family)